MEQPHTQQPAPAMEQQQQLQQKEQPQQHAPPTLPHMNRLARKQTDKPAVGPAVGPIEPANYNIWYGRHQRGTGPERKRERSKFRCIPKLDSGRTRGSDAGVHTFCVYFAKGQCYDGPGCQYLHRIPAYQDEARHEKDTSVDIFGRERTALHERGLNKGAGSFERECKTLYVNYGGAGHYSVGEIQQMLQEDFSEWGPIESIYVVRDKAIAFVKYEWRSSAEFAKEAMHNQGLKKSKLKEILTVRWANDDPNPVAIVKKKREAEDAFAQAALAAWETLPPEQKRVRLQQLQLHAAQPAGKGVVASYPNTDTQYEALHLQQQDFSIYPDEVAYYHHAQSQHETTQVTHGLSHVCDHQTGLRPSGEAPMYTDSGGKTGHVIDLGQGGSVPVSVHSGAEPASRQLPSAVAQHSHSHQLLESTAGRGPSVQSSTPSNFFPAAAQFVPTGYGARKKKTILSSTSPVAPTPPIVLPPPSHPPPAQLLAAARAQSAATVPASVNNDLAHTPVTSQPHGSHDQPTISSNPTLLTSDPHGSHDQPIASSNPALSSSQQDGLHDQPTAISALAPPKSGQRPGTQHPSGESNTGVDTQHPIEDGKAAMDTQHCTGEHDTGARGVGNSTPAAVQHVGGPGVAGEKTESDAAGSSGLAAGVDNAAGSSPLAPGVDNVADASVPATVGRDSIAGGSTPAAAGDNPATSNAPAAAGDNAAGGSAPAAGGDEAAVDVASSSAPATGNDNTAGSSTPTAGGVEVGADVAGSNTPAAVPIDPHEHGGYGAWHAGYPQNVHQASVSQSVSAGQLHWNGTVHPGYHAWYAGQQQIHPPADEQPTVAQHQQDGNVAMHVGSSYNQYTEHGVTHTQGAWSEVPDTEYHYSYYYEVDEDDADQGTGQAGHAGDAKGNQQEGSHRVDEDEDEGEAVLAGLAAYGSGSDED